MQLAFCGATALCLTRAVRSGLAGQVTIAAREQLHSPSPGQGRTRFTRKLLGGIRIGGAFPLPLDKPLEIAIPTRKTRPQAKILSCTTYENRIPSDAFVSLGDGLQMSSPELLFIEMAAIMPMFNLVLLGCELCGTFSRDPHDPINGKVSYNVTPLTDIQKMTSFSRECSNLPGIFRAREALMYVMDNAWSPMEAVVATLANLPTHRSGYGLGPVVLNKRLDISHAGSHESRVPDMLLGGTTTGLNYDGAGHLDLGSVVESAVQVALDPRSDHTSEALERSVRAVREKYVDDRRRDRELLASGHPVLVVTYEDLVQQGGLDRVMSLAMDSMERTEGVDLSLQRDALGVAFLCKKRQDLTWSCLPGELGAKTRRRMAAERRREQAARQSIDMMINFSTGEWWYL